MSESIQPPAPDASQSRTIPQDRDAIFNMIYHYPWAQDSEFQTGFSSIIADTRANTSESSADHGNDLLLQAQCFYFARKYNLPDPVDITAYKSWINAESIHSQPPTVNSAAGPNQTNTQTQTQNSAAKATPSQIDAASLNPDTSNNPSQTPPVAPYPQSFTSIIELITRNQPIPGIEEIPDTVLDASLSQPDQTPRRRKPWEQEDVEEKGG